MGEDESKSSVESDKKMNNEDKIEPETEGATESDAKETTPTTTSKGKEKKPLSIGRRMTYCFFWTIFGLVFFYLVMVFLSTISKHIVLDKFPRNGWARTASRHTATVTLFVFSLFMISSPRSKLSLFLSVMVSCAQFCHFVIISSDLSIYVDKEIAQVIFKDEHAHPIFYRLPIFTAHTIGTIGFFAMLFISSERCFGNALRTRSSVFPTTTIWSAHWITLVYSIWFLDHLCMVLRSMIIQKIDTSFTDVFYPLAFLLPLWFSHFMMMKRVKSERLENQPDISQEKKTN